MAYDLNLCDDDVESAPVSDAKPVALRKTNSLLTKKLLFPKEYIAVRQCKLHSGQLKLPMCKYCARAV